MFIRRRDIAACIIFTIITCGIYGFYWLCKMNDEVNAITGSRNEHSGAIVILLTIVTCGIYLIFWSYKIGEKIDDFHNVNTSKGVLYLIITLVGFSIITYALVQDEINKEICKNSTSNTNPPVDGI